MILGGGRWSAFPFAAGGAESGTCVCRLSWSLGPRVRAGVE